MIHKKLLSLLVLLMTVASGAWADIAQGDVFMFGSYIDFGTSVWCKTFSGGTDNDAVVKSTKLPLTYGGYENGKHRLNFNSANGTSSLYIVDTNSAKPWGIKVIGGDGSSDNPFTFSTVYDWPNNCPQELIIGTDGTCSFDMPASDATVSYDIVRDMNDATSPVEFSGISQKQKVVVKIGEGGNYQPLTALTIQLIDPLAATDAQNIIADAGIKVNVLRGKENSTGGIDYDETKPIAYDVFKDNMAPGLYKIVAEPTDATTSPYTGTASLEFEALAGFPVEVAAKEYVTYYSATDNLALEENAGAKLYTITNVGDTEATATEITSANAEMPFLLYNPTEVTKTFLLIPTDATINQTVYGGFIGTTEATTIPASTATKNNYALNGKQFVWVKNKLAIGANKAYLSVTTPISGQLHAPALNIVFNDNNMTGIGSMVNGQSSMVNGDWYDLNGRKLQGMPTKKGVYINNGRKVVVK